MTTRMAIAGVGAIGGFGHGWQALGNALREPGRARQSVMVDGSVYPAYLADLEAVAREVGAGGFRRVDRFARLAVLSSMLALADAGKPVLAPDRVGVIVATWYGSHESMFKFIESGRRFGDAGASPLLFSNAGYSGVLAHVTINLKLRGPGLVIFEPGLAFTAGLLAARQWLAEKRADAVLLIGQEECHSVLQLGFHLAFGQDAQGPIDPFGFGRQSAVLAEGSACFLLKRAGDAGAVMVENVAWLGGDDGLTVDGGEVAVVAADGMACCGKQYHRAVGDLPAVAPAAAYGSMPTGAALAMAAVVAAWREDGCIHGSYWHPRSAESQRRWRDRACLIECAKTGETGRIRLSRF